MALTKVTQNLTKDIIKVPTLYNYSGTITFSPCGATGRMGPTLAQARSTYTAQPNQATWLNDTTLFFVENGIQYWRVPKDGTYTIRAAGAGGRPSGQTYAGDGVIIQAAFSLIAGEWLRIVVGQQGISSYTTQAMGGSGGSAVSVSRGGANVLLICAGGGGGCSPNSSGGAASDRNASYSNSGIPEGGFGSIWQNNYAAGSNILAYWPGGGGAGWGTDGCIGGIGGEASKRQIYGSALSLSAVGGVSESGNHGGFGGGGATGRDGGAAGGGGGYKGGNAESWAGNQAGDYSKGGESYTGLGATQTNVSTNSSQGYVTVTL